MVRLLQHSAGPGCQGRRKILGVFLWFLLSELAEDAFSAIVYTSNENHELSRSNLHNSTKGSFPNAPLSKKNIKSSIYKELNAAPLLQRSSRALPRIKNSNEFAFENFLENDRNQESIQKSPTKSNTLFVIPYLRPGRSGIKNEEAEKLENRNTMIPMARFGRSNSDSTATSFKLENYKPVSKKYDTIIPGVRFGRNSARSRGSVSDSVIPYPRLGRFSSLESEVDITNNFDESSKDDYEEISKELKNDINEEIYDRNLDTEKRHKREVEDHDTIIPYPRPGRNALPVTHNTNIFEKENKRADTEYVIPQIRYGRSMILLSSPKTDETIKQNPNIFVVPYPRPGRSTNGAEKTKNSKTLHVMLPYPRPGRSKFDESVESLEFDKRQQGYMLPSARLGRSASNTHLQLVGKKSVYTDEKQFWNQKNSPLLLKSEQKNVLEKPKDIYDSSFVFVIPYPRPGKKSILKTSGSHGKQKPHNVGEEFADYVLSYPRPGKKSSKQLSNKNFKNDNNESGNMQNFILPYPRPGRSEANWFKQDEEVKRQENQESIESSLLTDQNSDGDKTLVTEDNDIAIDGGDNLLKNSKTSETTFLVPYIRPGRNLETVVPYPRPGRAYNQYKDSYISVYDDDMDSDLSISDAESFITGNAFVDLYNDNSSHLRYKRSNPIIPSSKLGRSESILPYSRNGRSKSVVPYPRLGRSNSVVPYPRLGRSDYVVPYPRLGRSDSVVLYPRFRTSNSVVQNSRLGRSNSVIPYPRLGRSNSVIPYPRLGRSNSVVPYPRLGRSDYVVPNPRLSRFDSVVPYPRLGRSDSVIPFPRLVQFDSAVPYPRVRKSDSVIPYPRPGRSGSVLPYPRPGRSGSVVPYPRPGRSGSVLPYPRLGRSLSVIPYPRLGRSSREKPISSLAYKDKTGNWILPNIRPGRSNSEEEKTYIIPYPRPGRSENLYDQGYNLRFSRIGQSIGDIKNVGEMTNEDTIIPYPRLGRSQSQVTPSPDAINSVHKLNKHMLTRIDDSIYLLPYPRPGRSSEQMTS